MRPLSSSTRWKASGPSPARTPVQSEVYGFMRSPVAERGSSCRKTSRSSNRGSTFSMPITVIRTRGSVVHMRPLPSDSTTATVPVSATAKFAPDTATRGAQEALAQVHAGGLGERGRVVRQLGDVERRAEEVADLGAVLVDRRHHDVRGRVACELHDQLGEIGLERLHAGAPRAPR